MQLPRTLMLYRGLQHPVSSPVDRRPGNRRQVNRRAPPPWSPCPTAAAKLSNGLRSPQENKTIKRVIPTGMLIIRNDEMKHVIELSSFTVMVARHSADTFITT